MLFKAEEECPYCVVSRVWRGGGGGGSLNEHFITANCCPQNWLFFYVSAVFTFVYGRPENIYIIFSTSVT
jgi:hypothetical protein